MQKPNHQTYGQARLALRTATEAIHLRLHHHAAMRPLVAGKIDLGEYRLLLCRLYGFHAPLERALIDAATFWNCGFDLQEQSRLFALRGDLSAIGVPAQLIEKLPTAQQLPELSSPGRVLGALYVREGSALGGEVLARRLDHLLGDGRLEGRRFLAGVPEARSLWRDCCEALEREAERGWLPDMRVGATETFAAFEYWLDQSIEASAVEEMT